MADVTLEIKIHIQIGQTHGAAALPVRPFAPLPGDLTVSTTTGATPLVNIQIVGKQTRSLSRSRSRGGDSHGKDKGKGSGTPRGSVVGTVPE